MDWTSNSSTGKKRPPNIDGEDDLITEQPLSKKLAKLSLHKEEQSRNCRGTKIRCLFTIPQHEAKHPTHDADQRLQEQRKQVTPDDELMEVDNDNSHVVFIRDIDEELDSDDNDKKGLIFVPDIEKRLTRIPYALANVGGSKIPEPSLSSFGTSQALVLYTVPSSLSVSREQDNVRRAIIEARARIRQRQAEDVTQQGLMDTGEVMVDDADGSGFDSGEDPDAMDIE